MAFFLDKQNNYLHRSCKRSQIRVTVVGESGEMVQEKVATLSFHKAAVQ